MKKKVARKKSSRILLAIWGGVVAIAFSAAAGFLLGQTVSAARITGKRYFNPLFDRITYGIKSGSKNSYTCSGKTINITRGSILQDVGQNCIQYYQPIPQEYGLGYLSNAANINRICSSTVYASAGLKSSFLRGTSKECFTKQTKKDHRIYTDHYRAASYMGDLYDVREYFWAAYRDTGDTMGGTCEARISHWRIGTGATGCWIGDVLEFHFYPRGSLEALDKYVYDASPDLIEVAENDPYDSQYTKTDSKTKIKTYYYDQNAYRDDDGKWQYTGTYTNEETGEVMTAQEYEDYLLELEHSIQLIGQDQPGVFKGYIRFADMDWYAESYLPARGGKYVYRTATSNIIQDPVLLGNIYSSWNGVGLSGEHPFCYAGTAKSKAGCQKAAAWYNEICPESIRSNSLCQYNYHGTAPSDGSNRNTSIWIAFESTPEEPFTLIYQVHSGWGSGASSEAVSAAYVLLDDLTTLPDQVKEIKEAFDEEYQGIYGKELEADSFISKQTTFTADQVLRKFQISQYTDFDPYTLNELLRDNGLPELAWYSCPDLEESCRIPNKKTGNEGDIVTINNITYYYHDLNDSETISANSVYHDFMDNDRIYYASMIDHPPVDFDNTCYSDNVSTGEIEQ